jgi:hypothetical protein
VEYQSEETAFIEEVEKVVCFDDPKPPEWWMDGDTLRFVYEYDWDHNLVCDVSYFSSIFWLILAENQESLKLVE